MADLSKILSYDALAATSADADDEADVDEIAGGASFAGVATSGFRDLLLKPELLRAIGDCGFEHPSEVQQRALPQACLGMDLICQAQSGMGKTAVFVLAVLQQIEPADSVDTLVLCHARELAYQICQEFERFIKYLPKTRVVVLFGGIPISQHREMLKAEKPHIVVGTPGRVLQLAREGTLDLSKLKRFVLDECDKMLSNLDMRKDVQEIFLKTPHEKQVMMFSATIEESMREVCRKFANSPIEIYIDTDGELTLHGLQQHYVELKSEDKTRKLTELLDELEFNQVVIFVSTVQRCKKLTKLMQANAFPASDIHSGLLQAERIKRYRAFKNYEARILVGTDVVGRGVDIEKVNIVINYDMPNPHERASDSRRTAEKEGSDQYLHRVGRAGRFGTKGLAISFISSEQDKKLLDDIQERFCVKVSPLPEKIEPSTYMQVA